MEFGGDSPHEFNGVYYYGDGYYYDGYNYYYNGEYHTVPPPPVPMFV